MRPAASALHSPCHQERRHNLSQGLASLFVEGLWVRQPESYPQRGWGPGQLRAGPRGCLPLRDAQRRQ